MSLEWAQKPMKPKDLGRWKLIADFQNRLMGIAERMGIASTFSDPKRQLHLEEYLGLLIWDFYQHQCPNGGACRNGTI